MRRLGRVDVIDCKLKDADVAYRAYQLRQGKLLYVAEGLAGYDSALQLGLRSLVADRACEGRDFDRDHRCRRSRRLCPRAGRHARADKALDEAYRRNNAGSYAEAAEFFAAASERR